MNFSYEVRYLLIEFFYAPNNFSNEIILCYLTIFFEFSRDDPYYLPFFRLSDFLTVYCHVIIQIIIKFCLLQSDLIDNMFPYAVRKL